MPIQNKEKVLFWLRRRERDLEGQKKAPTHTAMAEAGLSYQERSDKLRAAENKADAVSGELDAVQTAIRYIEENG